jgi:hypothetical protein
MALKREEAWATITAGISELATDESHPKINLPGAEITNPLDLARFRAKEGVFVRE